MNSMDADFGNWFAGFVDGEGCFTVRICTAKKPGGLPDIEAAFSIILRKDDLPILQECQRRTGVGRISLYGVITNRQGIRSNPRARWEVRRHPQCMKIVEMLDRHPLRAKKSRDFVIWREIILHLASTPRGNRWGSKRDHAMLIGLTKKMRDQRKYVDG